MNKKGTKAETSWGGVADWYDGLVEADGSYQKEVILPNLLRLVEPRPGMTLIDVACGQGFFSRVFAERGATVVGVDISAELIELAQMQQARKSISPGNLSGNLSENRVKYYVAPADRLPQDLKPLTFDVAVIVLAIQNIERYAETFAECARVLKQSDNGRAGKLFLVLNHPAFRIPKQSSWGFDEAAGVQYRRIDEYLGESVSEIDMTPGGTATKTISFHRPLQAYFKALTKSGFAVKRLEEWTSHKTSEKGPRQSAENRARREFPLFLMLEATKV